MMTIGQVQDRIRAGDYRISDHAVKRMIQKSIGRHEVDDALLPGKIIDEYPDDKYSPSCLIDGSTSDGKDLYIQVWLPPQVVVITTYDPDPEEWIQSRNRR